MTDDQEKASEGDHDDHDKKKKSDDKNGKKDKKKDVTPSGDNGNHDDTEDVANPDDNTEQNKESVNSEDNTGADDNINSDKQKKDKSQDKRKKASDVDNADVDNGGDDRTIVRYEQYGQDMEVEAEEEEHEVSAGREAATGVDGVLDKTADNQNRIIRRMATGLVTSLVGVGLLATGAYKYLWMLLLTLFTRKKRYKWHGIVSIRKNRFAEVRDISGSGLLYQDYIDKYKDLGRIFDELRKSGDYTLLPVNTKAEIKYGEESLSVVASEEEVFSVLNKLPRGIGTVKVNIYNDMAGFDMPLTFTL